MHRQTKVNVGQGWQIDVDEQLVGLVQILWRCGIPTLHSCEENPGDPATAYVALDGVWVTQGFVAKSLQRLGLDVGHELTPSNYEDRIDPEMMQSDVVLAREDLSFLEFEDSIDPLESPPIPDLVLFVPTAWLPRVTAKASAKIGDRDWPHGDHMPPRTYQCRD